MRLSTMVNLFYENTPDEMGFRNSVKRIAGAGFKVMDFTMCAMQRRATELNGDNWESIAYAIADDAAKLGVTFEQSHLPYPKPTIRRNLPDDEGCEQNEYFIEMTNRAIKISSILGVKWAIVHPVMKVANSCADIEADIAYNHEIYNKYIEYADKLGVGIAFENMADIDSKRRFGASAAELNALLDSFGDNQNLGICWDFGHGNRTFGKHQIKPFTDILPRLRATHVDDNVGTEDLHTLPFLGKIKWAEIMPYLRDYDGCFNYEIKYTQCFPEELKEESARFAYRVGEYLISLAK